MKTTVLRARRHDFATAAVASVLTLLVSAGGIVAAPTILQSPPRNEEPPSISGAQRVGQTLTGNPGRWSGTEPISFRYTWVRCTARLADCHTVDDDRSYTTRSADLGKRRRRVTTG